MSRSVTVAVAYIMSVTSLNWKEALKVVRVGRSVANPNIGFQKQLQEFEMFKLVDERRRLKERFPSLALVATDEEECQVLLNSYQGLLLSKDLCEGKCVLGEVCPTGLCHSPSKRFLRRKSSSTPPQSPRLLPPTPSTTNSRSSTNLNSMGRQGGSSSRRPKSGPGGLSSYAASAASLPPSCSSSRQDLSQAGVVLGSLPPSRSSSRHNLASLQSQCPSSSSIASRRIAQSAPATPMTSPQHLPRRTPDS